MKKVLILGATGMLGSALYGVLKDKYKLVLSVRDFKKITLLEGAYGGTNNHQVVLFDVARVYEDFTNKKGTAGYFEDFLRSVDDADYVINAIGIIIPSALENPAMTFFVNGALPHLLADKFKDRFIHITTDCAYDGKTGFPYDENSPKTPVDLYGLSKSLGEPEKCLTLRTSIIGREIEGFNGLLEWFLRQKGEKINGYSEHFWNGVTTKQFGKICDQIMQNPERFPKSGIFHVFSDKVSKYDMLLAFKKKYNVDCTIVADTGTKLNRTLATVKELNGLLGISSFEKMTQDL